jgi:Tfp pilus assembly protein PilW
MISIVIGMVVVGAVFATYLSVGTGSRNSRAMAQMTEDVSLAMNVLRSHIAMAGFSTPTGVDNNTGRFSKNYTGMAIKGCSSAFTSTDAAIDVLACSGAGADSIAVVFEADERNAIQSGGNFLDCLGNTIPADGAGRFLSYSRFYVSNGQLYCRGPGNNAGQALVENIHDMKIYYGVASAAVANQVAYYSRAGNAGEMNNDDFNRTVSARICLVVTTENEVLDNATAYTDCEGNDVTPADRRLYRAFSQTIVLQNRMGTN